MTPLKMQLFESTGLIAVIFRNSSVIKFFTPTRTECLYALNTGIHNIIGAKFFNSNLYVAGNQYLKQFDCANWSGESYSFYVG